MLLLLKTRSRVFHYLYDKVIAHIISILYNNQGKQLLYQETDS